MASHSNHPASFIVVGSKQTKPDTWEVQAMVAATLQIGMRKLRDRGMTLLCSRSQINTPSASVIVPEISQTYDETTFDEVKKWVETSLDDAIKDLDARVASVEETEAPSQHVKVREADPRDQWSLALFYRGNGAGKYETKTEFYQGDIAPEGTNGFTYIDSVAGDLDSMTEVQSSFEKLWQFDDEENPFLQLKEAFCSLRDEVRQSRDNLDRSYDEEREQENRWWQSGDGEGEDTED